MMESKSETDEDCEILPAGMADGLSKAEQINMMFQQADTNGDGKIDKEELIAHFNKIFDSKLIKECPRSRHRLLLISVLKFAYSLLFV